MTSPVRLEKVLSQLRGETPPKVRHEGLFGYLRDDVVPLALVTGLFCTLGIIPYTTFLSRQTYECPSWALGCQVYTESLGTIQGAVTLVYTIGSMCLAYACWALAEVSLWPLLCKQPFTYTQIDRFLAVSRGSIPAIPLAFGTVKRWETGSIITCAVLVTLISLSTGPVVGFVFDLPSLPTTYEGHIDVGGGSTDLFHQQNPPIYLDVAASGFYSDWFSGYATTEPMPDYRDWIIDRQLLSARGNFTATAVMMQKKVNCTAFNVTQTTGPNSGARNQLYFHTMLANVTDRNNQYGVGSESVAVYNTRLLSTWVHDVQFISPNRTRAELVFAVPGGIVEGSATSFLNISKQDHYSNISAVACGIDIELIDAVLTVGNGGKVQPPLPSLSSIQDMLSGNYFEKNATNATISKLSTHAELALLIAVAPVVVGNGYAGNQPTFIPVEENGSHTRLVSSGNSGARGLKAWDYVWQRRQIEDFIEGSISALSMSTSLRSRETPVNIKSVVFARRMEPVRNAILAVPVAVLLLIWAILAFLTRLFHRQSGLRVVRMGETAELIEGLQNGLTAQDNLTDPGTVRVMYQSNEQGASDPMGDTAKSKLEKSDLVFKLTPVRDDCKSDNMIDNKVEELSSQEGKLAV